MFEHNSKILIVINKTHLTELQTSLRTTAVIEEDLLYISVIVLFSHVEVKTDQQYSEGISKKQIRTLTQWIPSAGTVT